MDDLDLPKLIESALSHGELIERFEELLHIETYNPDFLKDSRIADVRFFYKVVSSLHLDVQSLIVSLYPDVDIMVLDYFITDRLMPLYYVFIELMQEYLLVSRTNKGICNER